MTALPRTLLDLAASARFDWLERMIERSEELEIFDQIDCYWPEFRFAVELDVFETHGTRAAFERDRKRQEDLLLAGIGMTRVTGPRLEREPTEVIKRVARLLAQRGATARAPYRVSSMPSGV